VYVYCRNLSYDTWCDLELLTLLSVYRLFLLNDVLVLQLCGSAGTAIALYKLCNYFLGLFFHCINGTYISFMNSSCEMI